MFFFSSRRRHTRLQGDWSSDVCSSDLRITRLRQRIQHLEDQHQQLADEAALEAELRVILGRLEDFAAKVHEGLEDVDWSRKREIIRALVQRVEVTQEQVQVVFRVDPHYGEPELEKKSLQLCRESTIPPPGQYRTARTGQVYGIQVPEYFPMATQPKE